MHNTLWFGAYSCSNSLFWLDYFEDQIIQNLVLANFDFDLNPALNAGLLIAEIKNVALITRLPKARQLKY